MVRLNAIASTKVYTCTTTAFSGLGFSVSVSYKFLYLSQISKLTVAVDPN